jgi:hypothetical protein
MTWGGRNLRKTHSTECNVILGSPTLGISSISFLFLTLTLPLSLGFSSFIPIQRYLVYACCHLFSILLFDFLLSLPFSHIYFSRFQLPFFISRWHNGERQFLLLLFPSLKRKNFWKEVVIMERNRSASFSCGHTRCLSNWLRSGDSGCAKKLTNARYVCGDVFRSIDCNSSKNVSSIKPNEFNQYAGHIVWKEMEF